MVSRPPSPGFIYTTYNGQIIFADNIFLQKLGIPSHQSGKVIGKLIYNAFDLDKNEYASLSRQIMSEKIVDNIVLRLLAVDEGRDVAVLVKGVASFDLKQKFIGIDYYILKLLEETQEFLHSELIIANEEYLIDDIQPSARTDNDIQQIETVGTELDEARRQAETIDAELVTYCKHQSEGLYALLLNLGGTVLSQSLEKIINETALINQSPIIMRDGEFMVQQDSFNREFLLALLYKVGAYAIEIIGKPIVVEQLKKIDEQSNPVVFTFYNRNWHEPF